MTRMTRPDCVVMCNLINTHTHTHTHTHTQQTWTVKGTGTERERERGWKRTKERRTGTGTGMGTRRRTPDGNGGPVQRLGGRGDVAKFVPVLGGDGTKIAPTGDISNELPGGMS